MCADIAACFETYRARVYRWAYALCGQHEDALDVVQEVFLRMWRRPPELASGSATVAWLRRVTSRVVIDLWRAQASRTAAARRYGSPRGPQETPDAGDLVERLRTAIESLSEQQRLVLMAKMYDRQTFRQIADELGIAVPTAKTHYLRALTAVRERLKSNTAAGRVT
jgi:RNA polymerase sigma-70 factor (ECF subfamily)